MRNNFKLLSQLVIKILVNVVTCIFRLNDSNTNISSLWVVHTQSKSMLRSLHWIIWQFIGIKSSKLSNLYNRLVSLISTVRFFIRFILDDVKRSMTKLPSTVRLFDLLKAITFLSDRWRTADPKEDATEICSRDVVVMIWENFEIMIFNFYKWPVN